MDPMKQNDIQETIISDPVTGEVLTEEKITEQDETGKPVAGRYPWGTMNTEDLNPKEIENPVYTDDLVDGVRLIDPDGDDFVVDIDSHDGKQLILKPEEERQAEMAAVSRCTEWMKSHPGYTMDELKNAKKKFLAEAREEIVQARSTHAEHDQ